MLKGSTITCAPTRRVVLGALAAPFLARAARAEVTKLRIARQFGLGYTQLALMEDRKLIEKHAAAAGLGTIEVGWSTFRASDVMNDALLSGGLEIASVGIPGHATIWDRTAGARFEVKGLCGLNLARNTLLTREPGVQAITDYKPGMKIALPAVKVSNQAIYLQMAAAKQWGQAEFNRLDSLTVSMSHPDAVAALLSGGEITSYFGAPPFTQRAMKGPGVREVTNSVQILGTPASFNILATPTRFYTDNPILVKAVLAALEEATAIVNEDTKAAAETYARMTNDKTPIPELVDLMKTGLTFTLATSGTLPIVQFMKTVNVLRRQAGAWTDYMHPSAVAYGGS